MSEYWERERQSYQETGSCCFFCGEPCSGDVTQLVCVEGREGEVAICDDPDNCPDNLS